MDTREIQIRKVSNGYITQNQSGEELLYTDLEELFSDCLLYFEGKGKYFGGDKFAVVKIITEPSKEFPQVEPM